jgi:hypothetical protein
MVLQYKLEYYKNDNEPEDDSVYIHIRRNTPIYQNKIDKETYELGANRNDWMDGIFNIGGIVEASSRAYRLWVSKSPIWEWDEVLPPLLYFMKDYLEEDSLEELPGSGISLNSSHDRRDL